MEDTLVQDFRYTFLGADTPSFVFQAASSTHAHTHAQTHPVSNNNSINNDTNGENAKASPATHTTPTPTASATLHLHLQCDTSTLSNGQLDFIAELSTLALIAKKLLISANSPHSSSATEIAFYTNVRQTLVDFHAFINNLYIDPNSKINSFLSLQLNLIDWTSRLRHIYWLHLNFKRSTPPSFLSILYKSSLYSDPLINSLSNSYLDSVSLPYIEITKKWFLLGELSSDSSSENFYIKQDSIYFSANLNDTPSFIDSHLANLLFQTGYSIYYLKNYFNDHLWCQSIYNNNSNVSILNTNTITQIHDTVQSRLNQLLIPNFISEISHLNDILLLKSGDFINNIIINSKDILSKDPSSLYGNQLITIVQESIESSSIINNWEFKDYSRIDARLLNLKIDSQNLSAWDYFTLDFKLNPNINFIINKDYKEYLKIFNFLFKIVKVKSNLNSLWLESSKISNIKTNNNKIKIFKRKFDLMKIQFISFIDTILSFIQNNILILNFIKFIDTLIAKSNLNLNSNSDSIQIQNNKIITNNEKSNHFNLQELNQLHKNYINSISNSILFSNPINQLLYNLILIIEKFNNFFQKFLNLLSDLIKLSNLNGKLDFQTFQNYKSSILNNLNSLFQKLSFEIVNNFEINMIEFIKLLKLSNNQNLINLSILLEN